VFNPFSNATQQPKFPDGEMNHSLSRRLKNTKAVEMAIGATNGVMHCLIIPSLGVLACFRNSNSDKSVGAAPINVLGAPNQTVGFNLINRGAGTSQFINPLGSIENYRIVSQGMRLTQINNEEENDGWYEAVRLPSENNPEYYKSWPMADAFITDATVVDGENMCFVPTEAYWDSVSTLALPELPGYHSGQLKDLKNIEFKLQHQFGCCKPNQLKVITGTDGDWVRSTAAGGYAAGQVCTLDPSNDGIEIQRMAVCNNLDAIYIRIYGRTTGTRSKFIVEGMQNVEFQFNPASDLATFMTPNQKDPKLEMEIDSSNDNPSTKHRRSA
jgi:hypothetical protein